MTAELPGIATNVTIDGGGFTLSGANTYRGLTVASFSGPVLVPVSVAIQNLTIANTVATGGTGGAGTEGGGGGGAGLGGAIYVGDQATVTLSNVSIASSSAVGGAGGAAGGPGGGGGGGGMGGAGGTGNGGGGGFGLSAVGGNGAPPPTAGGDGILNSLASGGGTSATAGGSFGGGGGAGNGAAGGGVAGAGPVAFDAGGAGGYGGGGGGGSGSTGFGGNGGFGGGGGGGGGTAGAGGFGGGGGGTTFTGTGNVSAFGGGTGGTGGGGGAGLGGAIFVEGGGALTIGSGVTINGSAVTGGTGAAGAGDGSAYGSAIFLHGSGDLTFAPGAGTTMTLSDTIADPFGASGGVSPGSWTLSKGGAGTLVLSGANQYSGNTDVAAGILSIASDSNLGLASTFGGGSVTVRAASTLQLTADSSFQRQLFIEDGATVSVGTGVSAIWDGTIADSDTSAGLRITGGGALTLYNPNNTFSNGLTITGNTTVEFNGDNQIPLGNGALGAAGVGVQLGDATSGARLWFTGFTTDSNRNFTFGGTSGATFDVISGSQWTINGQISGPGTLTKAGAGMLVLSGANAYSGGTVHLAGNLVAGAANVFGTGGMDVRAGATLGLSTFNQTVGSLIGAGNVALGSATLTVGSDNTSTTYSGILRDTGSLVKVGTGTLTLSGANTYSGGTTVSGGTLAGTTTSLQGNILNNAAVTFDQAFNGVYTGVLSGTGTLTKAGTGTLTLVGSNTYTGATLVNSGVLRAGAPDTFAAASAFTLAPGTTLDLNNFGQTIGALTGTGTVTLGSAILAAGADNTSTTFGGAISGTGSFVKLGTGTLTLSGANTYSGGTIVSQGTLAGTTTSLQGNIQNSGVVEFNQASAGTYGGLLSGTGALTKSGAGTLTLSGANTYTGGTTISGGLLVGNTASLQGNILNNAAIQFDQAATGTYGGVISGSGTFGKIGAGTLTLASSNTFTGAAVIDAGTLRAGTANVFGPTTAVSVASGATFDLNGFSQSIGTLSGGGNFALGSATLTTGGDNGTATLSGVISGTGSLVKTGTGALTLLGANTYGGGTTVSGGSLIGDTASLQGSIVNNALVTFNQGTTGTYAGSMSGTGSLTKSGAGTLTLTGVNTYTGGTTIMAGTLIGTTGSLQGTITTNGLLVFDQAAPGTFNGTIGGAGSLQKLGAGTLTLGAANTFTGGTTISGGVLRAGAANVFSSGPISIGAGTTLDLNGFSATLNALSGTGNIALGGATLTTGTDGGSTTIAGVISGPGSLVKSGSGTLTLTGANTYSGGTTVSGGILLGNTTSLQGGILNDARVVFDQGFNGTYAGAMSGTGILEKGGSGTLTLAGTNTYTGGTVITGGSIVASPTSLSGIILNNGGLTFGGSTDGAFGGTLGGTGSLRKTGPSTLTLNGTHPFGGLTTVSQGTLALNGTLGGSVTVEPGAFFVASGGLLGTLTLNGTLGIPTPAFASAPAAASPGLLAATSGDRLTTPPLFTIDGNLIAGPGSTLSIPVGPGPNPSLLVNGVAALNGTTLDARPIELGTQRNLSYLALSAGSGLTVANSTVATNNPLLISSLRTDGNSLAVTIINLGVPLETAVNPNFASAGAAIDRMKGDLSGDRGFVVRELLALSDDELDDAMRQIAGEVHASNRHVEIRSSEAFTDMVRNQVTERDHEEEEGQTGWGGPTVRWFGQMSREHVSFAPRDGALGGGADITDGAGGFEFKVSDRFLVGGGGGLGFGSMSLDGLSAGSDFSAPRAFGVVGFKPRGFGIRGGGSFSRSKAKSTRKILIVAKLPQELGGGPLTGGIDREAKSEEVTVQSDQWSEYADHWDVGTYRFDYMFGVRRARFARDNFVESGAGALSLEYDGGTLNLTDTDVKVHWWRRKGATRPYIETFFRHSSGFKYTLPVEFAEEEDSDFETAGLPMGQSAFAGRMGVTFVRRIGSFTFEYRIRKAAGQTSQTGDFRFRF